MPEPAGSIAETSRLLRALSAADPEAGEKLLPIVYEELRAIAGRILAGNPRATLQATELIHEAYLRLVDVTLQGEGWDAQVHFQRIAARAMRFVLVDRVRARSAAKRGGAERPVTLDEGVALAPGTEEGEHALQVHEGLERLATFDPQLAQLVELRFFGGLGMAELAQNLGVSLRSAERSWRLARAWWVQEFGDRD